MQRTDRLAVSTGANANSVAMTGAGAVFAAASNGHVDIVRQLLVAGASPGMATSFGDTQSHRHKPHADGRRLTLVPSKGGTPLIVAIQNGETDIVELLLQNGALHDQRQEGLPVSQRCSCTHVHSC